MPAYRRTHELKCWESVFIEVRAGRKRAEFRRNDRDFTVGDLVVLQRWSPTDDRFVNTLGEATYPSDDAIDSERVVITHIVQGCFGIPEGFCMFSFAKENEQEK